ncbi:hypothetical protein CCR75_006682 [Bremia lactucae]|uniref:VASt domain-containing protein n=1 Tax=Bremia lactucae TaxID=4779 RepID=A0A976NZB7_BRELC|nr:hypothetical protein CCR75_006682 [Bremia lactucae]
MSSSCSGSRSESDELLPSIARSDQANCLSQNDHEHEQMRDQVICMIFDLPETTQFYQDFSCAIASTLAMHGRMYPTSSHVCFYSNVFGRERKILIPYESLCTIKKTTTLMFQHAIRLTTFDQDEFTFTSFWGNNRDCCYDVICKTRKRMLSALHPTAVNFLSSSDSAPSSSRVAENTLLPVASQQASQQTSQLTASAVKLFDKKKDAQDETHTDDALCDSVNASTDDAVVPFVSVTPRQHRVVSDVDSIAPKDISMTQIHAEVFPVSVDAFMSFFLLDNAPFGLDVFNMQMGSTEITLNPWMASLEDQQKFGMTRSIQFRVPIEAPIGPKSSQVDVLQCLKENVKGVRAVESSTRLVDIPYGDYFSVEDRWTIVPLSSDLNACQIFIEIKVVFGKSTFWKNKIEARAIKDNRAKWERWIESAKKFLDSRGLITGAQCVIARPHTSGTSSEIFAPAEIKTDDEYTKCRKSGLHKQTSSDAICSGARTARVKVFTWVILIVLLLIVLHLLQTTLSSIERIVLINFELIKDLKKQMSDIQAQGCPAITTTLMFQHAIRLTTFDQDEFTFTSFWGNNRDCCYDVICKTRKRMLSALHPTAVNFLSSSDSAPSSSRVAENTLLPVASQQASQQTSQLTASAVKLFDKKKDAQDETHTDDALCDSVNASTDDAVVPFVSVTPRQHRVVSDVDSIAPKDISMTQIHAEVFPVSVDAFMSFFLLDNAPFGLDVFNMQMGSTEITLNPWMASLEDQQKFGMTRSIQFRVPIEAPIGPKSSQVDVLQCLKENVKGVRAVESSTRLVDIPYGDYFSVEDRWTIVPLSSDLNACQIFIEIKVVFGKSTFWKNKIEARAIKDNRAKWERWIESAKKFLDSRGLITGAQCVIARPHTSGTSSEIFAPAEIKTDDKYTKCRKLGLHKQPSSDAICSGARTARVKVFTWVILIVLLLIVLHLLQTTLSSIERIVLINFELIKDLKKQMSDIQAQGCPAIV